MPICSRDLPGPRLEAVLAVRSESEIPKDQLAVAAVARLNYFVGYRPVPVLENRLAGEVYDHERFCPVPLYLRGVGVAAGPYQDLVRAASDIAAAADPKFAGNTQFSLRSWDSIVP